MNKRNPFYNSEGYPDPTAYYGMKEIVKEESEQERNSDDEQNQTVFQKIVLQT